MTIEKAKNPRNYISVQFGTEPELLAAIDEVAEAYGRAGRSAIIRMAARDFVPRELARVRARQVPSHTRIQDTFEQSVERLVAKHNGQQAEAARAAGVSAALISETLRGKGPVDPRGETWAKISAALGERPPEQ